MDPATDTVLPHRSLLSSFCYSFGVDCHQFTCHRGETGGNAKTRPDYSSGNGSGFADTNKDKGPNYEGKK